MEQYSNFKAPLIIVSIVILFASAFSVVDPSVSSWQSSDVGRGFSSISLQTKWQGTKYSGDTQYVTGTLAYPTDSANTIAMCAVGGYLTGDEDEADKDVGWDCTWTWGTMGVTFKLEMFGDSEYKGDVFAKGILIDLDMYEQVDGAYFQIEKNGTRFYTKAMLENDEDPYFDNYPAKFWIDVPSGTIAVITVDTYRPNGDDDFAYSIAQGSNGLFTFYSEDGNEGSYVDGFIQVLRPREQNQHRDYRARIDKNTDVLDTSNYDEKEEFNYVTPLWSSAESIAFSSIVGYWPEGDDYFAVYSNAYMATEDRVMKEKWTLYGNQDSSAAIVNYVFQSQHK